jgi:hypothetical protein
MKSPRLILATLILLMLSCSTVSSQTTQNANQGDQTKISIDRQELRELAATAEKYDLLSAQSQNLIVANQSQQDTIRQQSKTIYLINQHSESLQKEVNQYKIKFRIAMSLIIILALFQLRRLFRLFL